MTKSNLLFAMPLLWSMIALSACSDEQIIDTPQPDESSLPEWFYAGGELGTTLLSTTNVFEQPAPAIDEQGLYQAFKNGEALFEKTGILRGHFNGEHAPPGFCGFKSEYCDCQRQSFR